MKSLLVLSLLGIGVLLGPLLYSSPIKLVTQPSLPIKSFDQTPVDPKSKMVNLGNAVSLEIVYLPAGKFLMGSSAEEKAWATGPEGGATAGTERESYEGEYPRLMEVKNGFWMGRTEVSVEQFRQFVEESGYITDAEKPGGMTQVFDPEWKISGLAPPHPWIKASDKSWRDPNFGFPLRDDYPVVCISWNDGNAFGVWLTEKERAAGRLPEGMEYRLPTEAEWAYACRGGNEESTYYWWGNDLRDGEGRLNISSVDFLPGRNKTWPLAKVPWSDGFSFVSPVDQYGEKGRNGFGLADMLGNVWEIVLDHFDPKGGHEAFYSVEENYKPVCRGGNYFDVPGNARSAVRLGLHSTSYSDSRDGFRICLGKVVEK
ncbi:SUMF1/EgtB/PvdO family nonheme iron enzyme [uncultured Cyclobacterium sp.]|uniref:formylglycine-generating enzyme family protein n=1 Tax=uncultured Cyclobacterium sp. TaxID=453820 RepID=UPI0030EC2A51|tara:strand:+ start:24500 stop:25615 length:1116 start_codon:yes stop_codon:yes gene_type:complete